MLYIWVNLLDIWPKLVFKLYDYAISIYRLLEIHLSSFLSRGSQPRILGLLTTSHRHLVILQLAFFEMWMKFIRWILGECWITNSYSSCSLRQRCGTFYVWPVSKMRNHDYLIFVDFPLKYYENLKSLRNFYSLTVFKIQLYSKYYRFLLYNLWRVKKRLGEALLWRGYDSLPFWT